MTTEQKRWVAIGCTAVVIVGVGAYVARATLFPPQDAADKLLAEMKSTPEDQRFEHMRSMREKAEQMSEAEREKLRDGMRELFQAQMEEHVVEYENAAEADKDAILDKHIDEMVARRKEWEKRRAEREAQGGQGGQNGPGTPPTGGPNAGNGPGGREGDAANAGGPGGRRGPQSIEERKQREEGRNADSDVRRIRYFRALRERAQKRGIDMGRGPGGFGGGPGGGRGGPGGGAGGGRGR